jgi:hypothetical protein
MAKVKTQSWGAYSPSYTAYKGFFESFNCPLMVVSTASTKKCIVEIDGILTVTFDLEPTSASSSTFQSILITYKGNTTRYGSKCIVSRGLSITCACSGKFVYINHWDGWGQRFEVAYDKVSEDIKLSGWRDPGTGAASISSISLSDYKTGIAYALATRINANEETGKVTYAPAILKRSGIKSIEDPNFICCTAVDNQKKITMADQSEYFSVDTNILVPYEEESNE